MPGFLTELGNYIHRLLALTTMFFAVKLPLDGWAPLHRQIEHVQVNRTLLSTRSPRIVHRGTDKVVHRAVTAVMIYPEASWMPAENHEAETRTERTGLQLRDPIHKDHTGFFILIWIALTYLTVLVLRLILDELSYRLERRRERGKAVTVSGSTNLRYIAAKEKVSSLRELLAAVGNGDVSQDDDSELSATTESEDIEHEDSPFETAEELMSLFGGLARGQTSSWAEECMPDDTEGRHDLVSELIREVIDTFADNVNACDLDELRERRSSVFGDLLNLCEQQAVVTFERLLSEIDVYSCIKTEDTEYSDIFRICSGDGITVLKVVGPRYVSEYFDQLRNHLQIARKLRRLRAGGPNYTEGFVDILKARCVWDAYPDILIEACKKFKPHGQDDTDSTCVHLEVPQPYVALYMRFAGCPLADIEVLAAAQLFSILQQVVLAMAAAEDEFKFEHRNLSLESILVMRSLRRTLRCTVAGQEFSLDSQGVEAFVNDFSTARAEYGGEIISNDPGDKWSRGKINDGLSEIYGNMRRNMNSWDNFCPRTNILFLHHVAQELYNRHHLCATYNVTPKDRDVWDMFQEWKIRLPWFASATDFARAAFSTSFATSDVQASRLSWFF